MAVPPGIAISKTIGSPPNLDGSVHLLLEPIGPLSAGNDFNWWNLIVLNPEKTMAFERQGCYAVYVASGQCDVFFLGLDGVGRAVSETETAVQLTSLDDKQRESKKPGYFSLKIKNTGTLPLVAFVLLAVDPGTTPRKKP